MEMVRGVVPTQVSSLVLFLSGADLQFQGSATSVPTNPFTGPHAISALTDVAVSDLDRVEMSTYQARDTGGRL